MPNPPVVMGAMLQCSFGMAPSSMIVARPNVLIEGRPAATVADIAPMSNVPPFALCRSLLNPAVASATAAALGVLTPMPCTPLIVAPWTPMAPQTQVSGSPALTAGATATCAYGGVISIVVPGTTKTTAS